MCLVFPLTQQLFHTYNVILMWLVLTSVVSYLQRDINVFGIASVVSYLQRDINVFGIDSSCFILTT